MGNPGGVLVARRLDGFLVGWFAVLVWATQSFGGPVSRLLSATSVGVAFGAAQAAHFAYSYRLAYGHGAAAIRRHRLALVIAPIVFAVLCLSIGVIAVRKGAAAVSSTTSTLVAVVFFTSGFHFVRQAYGVTRLGAGLAGIRLSNTESDVLRFAVFPLWIAGWRPFVASPDGLTFRGFDLGAAKVPSWVVNVPLACGLAAFGALLCVLISLMRRGMRPTSVMIAPYAASVVWSIAPGSRLIVTSLAFAGTHSLQYLACCYRSERALRRDTQGRGALRAAYVLAVAVSAGMIVTRTLPSLGDRQLHVGGAPYLVSVLAFVFLNLNHYATDAVIWKSTGPVVRSMRQAG